MEASELNQTLLDYHRKSVIRDFKRNLEIKSKFIPDNIEQTKSIGIKLSARPKINLNTYSVTNDDRFIVRSRLLDDKTYEEIHSFFEIYDINLAKILDMDYTKIMKDDESLEKLLYLLISDDERLIKKVYDGDDFMAKIIREVKNNSDDFDNLLRYNRDVIFDGNEKEEAFEDGLERGVKKGYKLGVEQTAKEMLQENCDVNLICRVTKLSLDEVERLKEELK